jgi:hypothetical protein
MTTLQNIVNVVISSEGRGVTQRSFGIPLVAGKHDAWGERYRVYNMGTAPADLVADGIVADSPVHRAVSALARNTPKPRQVAVGRLVTDFNHTFELTVKDEAVVVGKVVSFNIVAPNGGATTLISYTVQSGDTKEDIAAALAALITAIADITAAAVATEVITCAADNVSEQWYVTDMSLLDLDFEDTTVDSSLVTELGEVTALYPHWYGLTLADPNSKARVTALAASIETQERIFGYTTHDTDVGNGALSTDIFSTLNSAQYFRTYGIYSGDQGKHAAATWMGNRFPFDPGGSTWAYKPLSGVEADELTASFTDAVFAKKGNYYQEIAGLPVTYDGKMAAGEWIDIIRGRDWNSARLRERVFGLFANAPKVPYTDPGVEQVVTQVEAQMEEGVGATYFAADPAPIVTAPLVADVSDANKRNRILPDINFEATLAGAIHVVDPLNGVIKV